MVCRVAFKAQSLTEDSNNAFCSRFRFFRSESLHARNLQMIFIFSQFRILCGGLLRFANWGSRYSKCLCVADFVRWWEQTMIICHFGLHYLLLDTFFFGS